MQIVMQIEKVGTKLHLKLLIVTKNFVKRKS